MARALAFPPMVQFFILAACFVIIVAGLKAAAPILAPILFAAMIAVAIVPIIRWLDHHGLPTWLAVLVVILAGVLLGVLLILFMSYSVTQLTEDLPVYQENLNVRLRGLSAWLTGIGITIPGELPGELINFSRVAAAFGDLLTALASGLSNALLLLLLFVVFSIEAPHASAFMQRRLGSESPAIARFVTIGKNITSYFRVRAINNLFVSLLLTLLLWGLGVDLAGLWGILAFFLGYIPNIGLPLAVAPAVILALLERGWGIALIVIVGAVVINSLGDNVLTPRLAGKALNMSIATIFLSFIFWTWVLGLFGAFISVPLTAIVIAALDSFGETRWVAHLMSAEDIEPTSDADITVPKEHGGSGEPPAEPHKAA